MRTLRFVLPFILSITMFSCNHKPDSGSVPVDSTPYVPPVMISQPAPDVPSTSSAEDDAIIAAVLANGDSEEVVPSERNDRACVFGNNYPGTNAELHECVNDARKNVLNLVRFDKFDPKNIRLFLNERCTKANYEKWMTWALAGAKKGDRRVLALNSSHGGEDTDATGRVCDVIVTWDMIASNEWSPRTEVTPEFLSALVRSSECNWWISLDNCNAGGDVRALLSATRNRRVRSVEGPALVKARIDKSIERVSLRSQLASVNGVVMAACQPTELASEGPNGGAHTDAVWKARKALPVDAKSGDIVREINRLNKLNQETQHAQLFGVNKPLWSAE